jgi:hypothetical protein
MTVRLSTLEVAGKEHTMATASRTIPTTSYASLASEAVEYVRSKMTVGALNKIPDVLKSKGDSIICVLAERSVTKQYESFETERYLRFLAGAAESTGCGNCGEQSALAFSYLMDRGIHPLDWMALQSPGDHAFVVIGRLQKSNESEPVTWGERAIVCDPWKGMVYPPRDLRPMWKYSPFLIYRKD